MKKIKVFLALTVAVIMVLGIASCGNNTVTVDNTSKKSKSETQAQTTDNSANEKTSDASKILVAYFSATGTTKKVAEKIAETEKADLYEIIPAQTYSDDDLDYNDDNSRTTKEQNDKTVRPKIKSKKLDLSDYETIYIGYPIWWGQEPRIMDTFVESYNFTGKTVIPFCTSGSSDIDTSRDNLKSNAKTGNWKDGGRLESSVSDSDLKSFINSQKKGD